MKILREPLLHFLLLGGALFGLFYAFGGGASEEVPNKIVVDEAKVRSLAENFGRTWQRPPTESELEGLIQDHVREEMVYREALALGLDRDDTIIRRRLRQKLEFIAEDVAALAEPTDDELRAYLAGHPNSFRLEPSFTFRHVYLNPDRRGEALQRDSERLLADLRKGDKTIDIAAVGDTFLLDHEYTRISASHAATFFGESFAARLALLETGMWHGPIASGYGVHLVRLIERIDGRVPPLEEVRDAVRRDWANARRLETTEKFYESLRRRYSVVVERPKSDPEFKPSGPGEAK